MSQELKPCAHCGDTRTPSVQRNGIGVYLECFGCRCGTGLHESVESAITAWNKRAQPAGEAEPVAWHIGNSDGSINKIGAVYIRRSLAEKHIESYGGELDARIVPLYAAPVPKRKPLEAFLTVAEWAAQGAAAWIVDVPDEPELGHWFAEEPAGEGYRSRPLYLAAPKARCHPAIECCGKEPCELATPPCASVVRKTFEFYAVTKQQPTGNAADWFAIAMNAAAYLEDAANCLKDVDAERAARGAAEHVRKRANELWAAAPPAAANQAGILEGWKLVPEFPTPEMIAAGDAFFDKLKYARAVYANMLAAAPHTESHALGGGDSK